MNLRLSREVRRGTPRGRRRRPGNRQGPGQEPRPAQGGGREGAGRSARPSAGGGAQRRRPPARSGCRRKGAERRPSAEGRASCGTTGRGRATTATTGDDRRRTEAEAAEESEAVRGAPRPESVRRPRSTALGGVTGQGRGSAGIAARSFQFCARGDTFAGRPAPRGGTCARPSEAAGACNIRERRHRGPPNLSAGAGLIQA